MVTVYGIPNCDTVKKARTALDEAGIAYRFHDFRKDGLSADLVQGWLDRVGNDVLVNRKGTTWRKLDADQQHALSGAAAAEVLVANPSVIKRPVIVAGDQLSVGFAPADRAAIIARFSSVG